MSVGLLRGADLTQRSAGREGGVYSSAERKTVIHSGSPRSSACRLPAHKYPRFRPDGRRSFYNSGTGGRSLDDRVKSADVPLVGDDANQMPFR